MRYLLLTITCTLIFTASFAQNPGGYWKLAKEKNGVKVYTQKSESSSIKDALAYVTIDNGSLDEVIEFFLGFDKHHEWLYKIERCDVLKKVSDDEYYVYYIADAPWPVSDRDVISHYKLTRTPGKVHVDVVGKPDYIPVKEDYVRVTESVSYWTFTSNNKGGVDLEYFNHASPGGSIPAWLANSAATDTPYVGLLNIKEHFDGEQ